MENMNSAHEYMAREIRVERRALEERLVQSCITGIHKHYYLKNDGTYNLSLLSQELNLGRKKIINILKEK